MTLERHKTNSSREEDNFSSPVNSRGKCMEGGVGNDTGKAQD
jgi:hypothetical protein